MKKEADNNYKLLENQQRLLDVLTKKVEVGELSRENYQVAKQQIDTNMEHVNSAIRVIVNQTE